MVEGSKANNGTKVLRYGMVGGGEGSLIGEVHRKAAAFDGKCQLVAGCFSRDYDNTIRTGLNLNIAKDRLYKSFEEMAEGEAEREDGIDFVTIVTPNYAHYSATKAFLNKGINVICDKPLVFKEEEAVELIELAKEKGLLFCVTYTYTGYPMVNYARKLISDGKLGDILMVSGEYIQDWLIDPVEKQGSKQAEWRTNPSMSGVSNCIGDIGSHLENMVSYMTGLKIKSLSAKLDIIGEGRTLDTNGSVMVKYENGASGLYWASQVAIGNENALSVRIFGTHGALEWHQEDPNYLKVTYKGEPTQILSRGRDYLNSSSGSRIPAGHPEGYYEAFANIYSKYSSALAKKMSGEMLTEEDLNFPDGNMGLDGVRFINGCVKSSNANSAWVEL